MKIGDLERVLKSLSGKIQGTPFEFYSPGSLKSANFNNTAIGINYGIHLTGGEPFLNFDFSGQPIDSRIMDFLQPL